MSPSTITILFLLFAIVMFVMEKIPLGVTSMIVCVGLVVTGVLDAKTAFAGFIDSNVILVVAMLMGGGAFFGKVGTFAEGYEFDALILDDSKLRHPQPLTARERLERLIYLSDDSCITGKYISGNKIF